MKNLPLKNPTTTQTDFFLAACGFFVFAITAVWVIFFVPMNMDEAGIYHLLACLDYPFAPLHTFREACTSQNDLITPLGLRIPHPEFYTGLWHTILYSPFYFLFHAPEGQYAFGLCFLLAFAALLARETTKPLLGFSIVLSFFPFVFQFVHDTGPVAYALLQFPLGAFFMKKIIRAPSPVGYGTGVVWAFFLVAAIEEKPFFLYLLPSVGFFALAFTAKDESLKDFFVTIKKARAPLFATAGVGLIATLFLLFSVNQQGQFYIVWLAALAQKNLSVEAWLTALTDFLFYWPSYARYTFDVAGDTTAAVVFELATLMFFIFCLAAAIIFRFWRSRPKARSLFLVLSFFSSVLIFFVLRNTWAGHHFIFLWVPLIALLCELIANLPPQMALPIVMGFFAINLGSVTALTQEPVQTRNARERAAIFSYFADDARASKAIINFSSWGGYYIQSLYGPKNQLVTYTEPYDEQVQYNVPLMTQEAHRLLELSQKTGRTLYNVCYGPTCDKLLLDKIFGGGASFEETLPGLTSWHVFAAKTQP